MDTLGLLLAIVVHGADWQDQDAAEWVIGKWDNQCRRRKVIFGDSAYGRTGLLDWVQETLGGIWQTVLRPVGVKEFVVLPKRWVVQRTFVWLARHRRSRKDYEKTVKSSEVFAMIRLMLKRLAKAEI